MIKKHPWRYGIAIVIVWAHCVAAPPVTHAQSADSKIKNVLFLISDDLKASVLGCYGDPMCKTPSIDELAQRGMVFDRAYCQGVWCAPSRESFMFSRYDRGGQGEHANLGEFFKSNGWYTARVGKIFHMRVPGDIIAGTNGADIAASWTERFNSPGREAHTPGDYACLNRNVFTDQLSDRQSTKMPHRMFVTVQYDGDGSDQPDYRTATKSLELLNQHQHEPFFLAVGFVRPHYPNVAPRHYFASYPWQKIEMPPSVENDVDDIPRAGWGQTRSETNPIGRYPDNQRRMWSGYYATVQFMDEQVGRILGELDRLGLRDSTAVVFTSDHGYHLGEHGFWQKSNLHEDVTRVPLIISAPGYRPGRTTALTELVDIYPTLSDLVGLEIPGGVQGRSLKPILQNPVDTVRTGAVSLHKDKGVSLRTDEWTYIRYQDGSEELYDMREDPQQFTNLASDPKRSKHGSVMGKLRQELQKHADRYELPGYASSLP